jgi:4-oxalocrotonate tautomerase
MIHPSDKEMSVPFIQIQTVEGILDDAQRKELLTRITDLVVEIEGRGDPSFRSSVWVAIDERRPSQWSVGGIQPTAEMVAERFPRVAATA